MIDFVIDHMENAGVVFASRNELASVTEGVKLYLLENGISEKDNRDYSKPTSTVVLQGLNIMK